MNTTLDKDQTELRILVFAVLVQMLANRHRLLDKVVQILWDLRRKALCLENAKDLAACHVLHLRDTKRITQSHTDLGRGEALLCQFPDVVAPSGISAARPCVLRMRRILLPV